MSEAAEYRGDTSALSYKQKFDYDRFGNLYRKNSSNPTAGQQNPLPYTPIEDADISKSTNRFTSNTVYDDAGNVTTDSKFRDMNFWYDANGRMFKTTSTISSGQSNAVYDASGNRVAQQIDGVWQFFIYDVGGKKVAEYGGSQAQDEGGIRYIFTDWQGSARAITGEGGVVQARMDYTAFGEEINANVGMRTTVQGFNAPNKLDEKYAQTERDKATGLDHTWFRKLENQGGRWTSPDPYNGSISLGNPQSFNRYSYVENQPTNFVDPSGLFRLAPQPPVITGLGLCWLLGLCGNPQVSSGGGEEFGGGSGGGGQSDDPCAKFLPSSSGIPSGVNIDDLIKETKDTISRLRKEAREGADEIRKTGMLGAYGAAAQLEAAVGTPGGRIDYWFLSKVDVQKPWDFKWLDMESINKGKESKYEHFGNIVYGAVGTAAGYSQGVLQRMAGWAQNTARVGESPSTKIQARNGIGGTYPYGDQLKDAQDIEKGIAYYNCRKENPR